MTETVRLLRPTLTGDRRRPKVTGVGNHYFRCRNVSYKQYEDFRVRERHLRYVWV